MSNLIKQQDIHEFEEREENWFTDDLSFDEMWTKKMEDEHIFFSWLRNKLEGIADSFVGITGLSGIYYSKVMDVLEEAALIGFFFGELRWNKDIKQLIDSAFDLAATGEPSPEK